MRLGQLARKLAASPGEIVDYLNTQNIQNEGSNTRLDNEQIALILQKFAPAVTLASILRGDSDTGIESTPVAEIDEPAEPAPIEFPVFDATPSASDLTEKINQSEEQKTDIIKAPKVELPGLKVVGKIDLPEPKKKELQQEEVKQQAENTTSADNKNYTDEKNRAGRNFKKKEHFKNRGERHTKNPIALQREREAREAKRKKQEEAKRLKEKRTQNYLKKVKPPVPTKRAKLIDEPLIQMEEESKEAPTTLWGKFWKWFWRE